MCLKGEKVENTCEGDSGKFRGLNIGSIGQTFIKLIPNNITIRYTI